MNRHTFPRLFEYLARFDKKAERNFAMQGVLNGSGHAFVEAFGRDEYANLMLDASHKAAVMGYKNPALIWRNLVRLRPVSDFKTQNAIMPGAFGNLTAVKEFEEYPLESFTDEKATWSVTKYGKRFGTSLEARVNDELGQLAQTVEKMGQAAARTVENWAVDTMLVQNPSIYDGNSLFDSTNHSNDGGTAGGYTRALLVSAIAGMMTQTGRDSEYIGIMPKYLLVRPSKVVEAMEDVASAEKISVDSAAAANVLAGRDNALRSFGLTVLTSPWLTTDAFYLLADPASCEGLRMGFLGGQETPEILREASNSGWSFAHDAEQFKIRSIFGGAWVDWRGVYRDGV